MFSLLIHDMASKAYSNTANSFLRYAKNDEVIELENLPELKQKVEKAKSDKISKIEEAKKKEKEAKDQQRQETEQVINSSIEEEKTTVKWVFDQIPPETKRKIQERNDERKMQEKIDNLKKLFTKNIDKTSDPDTKKELKNLQDQFMTDPEKQYDSIFPQAVVLADKINMPENLTAMTNYFKNIMKRGSQKHKVLVEKLFTQLKTDQTGKVLDESDSNYQKTIEMNYKDVHDQWKNLQTADKNSGKAPELPKSSKKSQKKRRQEKRRERQSEEVQK